MHKRILQVLGVICLAVTMCAAGSLQALASQEAVRLAQEQAAAEKLAQERAAEALAELKTECPDLHIGCTTFVDNAVAMSTNVELPEPVVEELSDDKGIDQEIGSLYNTEAEPPLVAIDPGHLGFTSEGYKNTGAQSALGTIEYEWALEIGLLLKEELVERGYNVYMVRTNNNWKEFPYNLGQRTEAVNNMDCDIMVAIHWDSFVQQEVDGYHTIYKGNKKSANYRLAKAVSDAYGEALDGGVSKYSEPISRDDLWQLNVAKMPAIIVECGFSSNIADATYLENEENYETIVNGLADGVDLYFMGESSR